MPRVRIRPALPDVKLIDAEIARLKVGDFHLNRGYDSLKVVRKGGNLQTGYAASKGALLGAARSLALELGRYKIRVNSVVPGWMLGPPDPAARLACSQLFATCEITRSTRSCAAAGAVTSSKTQMTPSAARRVVKWLPNDASASSYQVTGSAVKTVSAAAPGSGQQRYP